MATQLDKPSAADWCVRLGEPQALSSAERAAFTDFLRESPLHVRELIEQMFVREDLRTVTIPQALLDQWVDEARVVGVDQTIPFPRALAADAALTTVARRGAVRRPIGRRHWLAAASLALALLGGAAWLHARSGLYTTGFGEQRILTLSDGSVVSLNTESQMRVQFSAHRRSIALQKGEAFFRVAHDVNRPFYVSADNVVVRAVGTQFNVKIAPQDTVVSMVDGVVKLSLEDAGAHVDAGQAPEAPVQILLHKGEEARVNHTAATRGAAPPIHEVATPAALSAASWTQGRLEFDGTPLADVLAEFQRYRQFDVDIDDEATRQLKLTGSFDSDDPASVLAYIATIPGMAVEQRGPHSYRIFRR